MRKRGWGAGRWFGRSSNNGSLLDRLRNLHGVDLREVRELENFDELPEHLEAGAARWQGSRPIALLASRREGLDLLGWARIAARRAGAGRSLAEVLIAAPEFSERTRRAASRAAERGPSVHLLTLPALAEDGGACQLESHPAPARPSLIGGSTSVLARVLRVLEGAAAVSGAAGVRPAGPDHLFYVRGERAARVSVEGDEVVISVALPERRTIRANDASFARIGADLYEWVVRLADDPSLLEGAAARRDALVESCADEAHAGVTARWLPWNEEGSDAIDWVGIDIAGRPVVGAIRPSLDVADVPGLIAGWHLLDLEREVWSPGAVGDPRIFVSSDSISDEAREILEAVAGPIGERRLPTEPMRAYASETLPEAETALDSEDLREDVGRSERRGGRRRGRRRGRGGDRGTAESSARVYDAASAEEERNARREARRAAELRGESTEAEPAAEGELDSRAPFEAELEPEADAETRAAGEESDGLEPRRGRRGRRRRGGRRGARIVSGERAEADSEALESREAGSDGEARAFGGEELEPGEAPAPDEALSSDMEATLAQGEEESETGPAAEPVEVSPPRARRQRAAILVRDDPDSILAALVLARDRRTIVSFRVAPQEGLMDFFKGPATDIADNVDVLVVGYSAQPRPKEVLDTAELFRGRLQWFDHHEWAIEDLVRLRAVLGRDSIVIEENATSPLGAVCEVTERRSRFTDKLVDLSARRLSETDMQKWGNRVIALIKRLAETPGEHRAEIVAVLNGKPTDLPSAPDVYRAETDWVAENDPRMVHFGEYQLAVARVPSHLDPGEIGRRLRLRTGARLSLATVEGDDLVVLSCNDEKRPLNVSGLIDAVGQHQPWVIPKSGGDRIGRARIDGLPEHPERFETLIGEIVRHRSVLYG